ncbi:MAG: hypothetical protein ACOC56_01865, partial [Atribacterota bacterium]
MNSKCCGLYGVFIWTPNTEGQECHWLAGEHYMCKKCGETLRVENFYSNFLQSEQWEKIRFEVFIRDSFYCQDCGREAS